MRLILFLGWLGLGYLPVHAQEAYVIDAPMLAPGQILRINTDWRYHPGDHPQGADPLLDDSDWTSLPSILPPGTEDVWTGKGWFRLRIKVAPELWGKPLGIYVQQSGASEVYLNGERVFAQGQVGDNAVEERPSWLFRPRIMVFAPQAEQILAVRYSNYERLQRGGFGRNLGFLILLQDSEDQITSFIRTERRFWGLIRAFAGIYCAFALLHLILFIFSPRQKAHLFFSLFNMEMTGYSIWVLILNGSETLDPWLSSSAVEQLFIAPSLLTLLMFTYALFRPKLPPTFWFFLAVTVVGIFLAFYTWNHVTYMVVLFSIEILRVAGTAVFRGVRHAWILGVGLACLAISLILPSFSLTSWYQAMMNFIMVVPPYWGLLALIVCTSLYLALTVAQTNKDLSRRLVEVQRLSSELVEKERREKEQEIQHRLLEADYARKSQELEEARQFQLSLLPDSLPDLPQLTCDASMETAAEVGGDYYDFILGQDGTLTLALGDATGHGTRAGTMVAAIKGLFSSLAQDRDIPVFFKEANLALKRMGMKQMFMGLTLARIQGDRLTLSAAGMPPVYLFRKATGEVEPIRFKALPLGGIPFPYVDKSMNLCSGDTLLLMSDGLPELFAENGEMYGEGRIEKMFQDLASETPADILRGIRRAADGWRGQRPFEDDMTLAIVQMKA